MTGKLMPTPRYLEEKKIWRLDARYKNKRKAFYSKHESPRKAAADLRQQYLDWVERLDLEIDGAPNVRLAWEEFISSYARKNKITSTKRINIRGRRHIVRAYGSRKVDKIKKQEWQLLLNNAHAGGAKSYHTLKGIENTIRSFCKFCATRGWIHDHAVPLYFDNPAALRDVPEKRILQPDKLILLLTDDSSDWYVPMYQFIVLTGLRRGELCALQSERDYLDGIITVRESVSHDLDFTDGKTTNAQRSFAPVAIALNALERHLAQRDAAGIKDSPWLFCAKDGDLLHPRVLGNQWRKWREKNGIDVTLHELRHTFLSYARTYVGMELEDVKAIVGHAEKMDTDATYVHPIKKSAEEVEAENRIMQARAEAINTAMERLITAVKRD